MTIDRIKDRLYHGEPLDIHDQLFLFSNLLGRIERLEKIIERQKELTRPSNYELSEMATWEKIYNVYS